MINVYSAQEIDEMIQTVAQPLPASTPTPKVLPVFVDLFGPVPGMGLNVSPLGSEWAFLTALTASTKLFEFWLGYPQIARARWMLVWTPNNVAMAARLIAFDQAVNGVPMNLLELATIQSEGYTTPVPQAVLFTMELQKLVEAKQPRQIGVQFKDDGINHWVLFENRLEINFQL